MGDQAYKVAFILLFCALTVIRATYRLATGNLVREYRLHSEGLALLISRSLLGLVLAGAIVIYLRAPHLAPWARVALPGWLRTAGIVGGVGALALLLWSHRALDGNFSTTIELRPNHRLVREGPYRWMRHPMYAAYALLFICAFLISQNWVIGLSGLGIILPLMTVRLVREEQLLRAQFGSAYTEYARRTARFFPWGTLWLWKATARRTASRLRPAWLKDRD
jgi:protein-S-isoprenylcysteine O-methyltransferase Ste14